MAEDIINNIHPYKYFWDVVLSKPASSLPKGAQWYAEFAYEDIQQISKTIKEATAREGNAWNLDAGNALLTNEYQSHQMNGCVFCQAIRQPGESMDAGAEGNISSNGLIRSFVGRGRNSFEPLRMTFLDTNISFTDTFLRGWTLATAHYGMIARTDHPYRATLTCYKLGYYSPETPVFVTSKITFNGVCCISVSPEELNYQQAAQPLREAQFVFNNYSIDATPKNGSMANNVGLPNYKTQSKDRYEINGPEIRKAIPVNAPTKPK
jgi:hypothetical protein